MLLLSMLILMAMLLPFLLVLALGFGVVVLLIRRPIIAVTGLLSIGIVSMVLGIMATHVVPRAFEGQIPVDGRNVQLAAAPAFAANVANADEISLPAATAPAAETTAADRPAWIEQPAKLRPDSVYEIAVKSGLYVTAGECQRGLESAERAAVDDYLESYLGPGAARLVALDTTYVRDYLQMAEYAETTTTSVGKMQQLHALLAIDDGARRTFRERWRQALVVRRLKAVGGGAGLTLALIAAAYGFLSRSNRRARAAQSLAAA